MAELLAVLAFVALIWGASKVASKWQNEATEKKYALAWTFLTWTDDDAEKQRQSLLSQPNPGKFSAELEALAMSRQMRADLRGDLLSSRPHL